MNTFISPSIIVRVREIGESDLLVTFFTRDRGLRRGVAKGARKSRKRFVNCLDLLCLAELEYRPGKGDLCLITSGKLLHAHPRLRKDFSALARASYMVELAEILFPWGVVSKEMFDLLRESLRFLEEDPNPRSLLMAFELRAMELGGYGMDLKKCCHCGRDYEGKGTAVFLKEKGGIACLRCARPSKEAPELNPEAVKYLANLQSGALKSALSAAAGKEIMDLLGSVLRLHREYHLGLRLKSLHHLGV
ncbi:MAG: DNA repair protein RecO [Deltaproteobacteria bacterium]|nr:DNA repair protein RecO [Deltaproteobacteria bacterium]MBW2016466.1 DNA repair protein RecO [Deltaproteobacteria bacterium]MBW2302857.1 DNA repair protein RecO [Deltaproteobacteria bacterium]